MPDMAQVKINDTKNHDGDLGPICNNCAGLGFTLSLGGSSMGCKDCGQTGIAQPKPQELQKQINDLKDSIEELTKLIKERNV